MQQGNTALIIGATGLVGRHLANMLAARYSQVVAIVRNAPSQSADANITYHELANFEHLADCLTALPDTYSFTEADAFSTLGTTQKDAGGKAAFAAVDYGYNVTFAKTAQALGVRRLFLLSSMGADSGSKTSFYLRIKGELEDAVAALGFEAVYVFQPSLLLGEHKGRLVENVGQRAFGLVKSLVPSTFSYRPIEAMRVAKAMVLVATDANMQAHNAENNSKTSLKINHNNQANVRQVSNADMLRLTL